MTEGHRDCHEQESLRKCLNFDHITTASTLSLLRWCTVSDQELAKCSDMSKAFSRANLFPELACVNGGSVIGCTSMINRNLADAATVDGGILYQAGKEHGLKPVVAEAYGQDVGTSYYAVAVVKASSNLTINRLNGAKTCHTGINRTAGWNIPVGLLLDSGRMPMMGCSVKKAVSDYFKASCVPGATAVGDPASLCELCKGDSAGQSKCELSPKEKYYDYLGAFRCLVDGPGEVAFVKHTTVTEAMDGQAQPSWTLEDFQLLCRDGSRAAVSEWRTCHLARVPAHAIITRQDVEGSLVFEMLDQGQQRFSGGNSSFQMFDSTVYGGKNLLFKDSTAKLVPIMEQTYQAWLGDEYLHAMRGLDCDPKRLPEFLRWCVLSTEEIWKCSKMAAAFKSKNLKPEIQCVSAQSPEQCMERIQKRDIDAVVLAGKDVYVAGKTYGLVPAAAEHYADGDTVSTYYAVAVVKRETSDVFSIHELQQKRSCHTGYGRMAGWNIPIGLLLRKGFIQPQECNLLKAVSGFFSASCIPTAKKEGYPANLCELCIGDSQGNFRCNASSQETYYGYTGAFRCLAEGHGDVAFVKHSSVFENTDGHNSDDWASRLRSGDFQLLCPNGARAEVNQFAGCHWGQVPPRAVMVHPDTNALVVYGLLDKAQDFFGNDNNGNRFKMFSSSEFQKQDLIFKDSTVKIVPVGERRTFESWLGQPFLDSLEGILESSSQCSRAAIKSLNVILLLMTILTLATIFT
ncbi:melanotransferrin-like [Ahaetulla prasina]|uniref:melanotransferrin-like n=1 Tax=Ahaetulla prasina TaxID=499056 RepID=UPI00264889C4|nr:melanotransferrin-like [Ahaetulla prasina]